MFGNIRFGNGFDVNHPILQGLVLSENIIKGIPIRAILGQGNLPNGATIFLSIVGEKGDVIKDQAGVSLSNVVLNQYDNSGVYYKDFTIHPDTPDQYIRLFYTSNEVNISSEYQPQDVKLIGSYAKTSEIVPLQYFLDYVLNADNMLDPLYKKAVGDYVAKNREGVRAFLKASEGDLERKTKLYFSERLIEDEKKDYFFDRFNIHLWQFQVANPPINQLVKFQIKYGENKVAEISPELFVYDKINGIIEFLPAPSGNSAGVYPILMNNLALTGTGLTFLTASNLSRIPALFRATYKTGLIYDGCDEREKESIRMAICNRALIKILPKIDPAMRSGSYSESIDGVSSNRSYLVKEVLREYQEQEEEFCQDMRLKYGRNLDMVIV